MAKTNPVHRTRIDGTLYPYSDAKKDVTIQRELIDVWKGTPGQAGACMNAQCIMRNKAKFPHKVLAASVIKSRVYVFDSPNHVVRYTLSKKDSRLIEAHDTRAIGAPGVLRLRAPEPSQATGVHHGRGTDTNAGKTTGRNNKPLARGEKQRVLAAVGSGQ